MRDYFSDERMWATYRRRWQLLQWWKRKRLLLLCALIIAIWALATYYDERDKRLGAEAQVSYLVYTLLNASCYATERPTTVLIAGDSQEQVDKALVSAASAADGIRMGWLIARTKGKK